MVNLKLYCNEIIDISPLSDLTNLTELWLHTNQIVDISPLSGLMNLTSIWLGRNQIVDISPLVSLTSLLSLDLNENQITDISSILNLTNLISISLESNEIINLPDLSNLNNLLYLKLDNNQISDISGISTLINLESLSLKLNQIVDISPLSGLTNLLYFYAVGNQIVDISPLSGLMNLTTLKLDNNQITNISFLSDLTSLSYLDLRNNEIIDIFPISDLISLFYLNLRDNQISDIYACIENTGLGDNGRAGPPDMLYLENNPLFWEALDVHIPILESREFWILNYSPVPNSYTPCYPNPERYALEIPVNTGLQWQGNFDREVVYEVWLGESPDNLINIGNGNFVEENTYSITVNLDVNTEYWWKVKAITETENIWSGLWSFRTITPLEIPIVNINVVNNNPELNWSPITGATSYNIYRSTDPNNFGDVYDTTTEIFWIDSEMSDKMFYRVTAVN